ncbi:MAG: hypothetical protein IBX71_10210 [Candidatus Desulforudis sp.]|nr:hypothetical protein [Desulforudis sp.]
MRLVVTLLIIGVIAWLGFKRFAVTRDVRELTVNLLLLGLGTFIAFAGMMGYNLPNPNDYLAKVIGPLSEALGLTVTWR